MVEPTSAETLEVSFLRSEEPEDIGYFYARLADERNTSEIHCITSVTDEKDECELVDLQPGRYYTVEAQACLRGSRGCGDFIAMKSCTKPLGEFLFDIIT